jgi:hypothetical protein
MSIDVLANSQLPRRVENSDSVPNARLEHLVRWLPTAGSAAALVIAALLALGAPAGDGAPGSTAPLPVRGAPTFQPPILVLIDSDEDKAVLGSIEAGREVVLIDVREGAGDSVEAARELAALDTQFDLLDLRAPY